MAVPRTMAVPVRGLLAVLLCASATPGRAFTPTATGTATKTETATGTGTATRTGTQSDSVTGTPTVTVALTPTATMSETPSVSLSETLSSTGTETRTATLTPPPTPAPPTPAPATPVPATPAPPTPATPTPATPTPEPATASPPTVCTADTLTRQCLPSAPHNCLLRVLHPASPLSVAYSPDSREVAVGGSDGVLRVFTAATGSFARVLGCADFPAHDVAFSPDGGRVAVCGGGGRLVVCDATTGAALLQLEGGVGEGAGVRRVRFSPDGRVVVAAGRREARTRLHNAVIGGRPHLALRLHAREVAFTHDGAHIATVTGGEVEGDAVHVLYADNGQQDAVVASPWERVVALSFSPNGQELLRGADDGTVRVGPWAGGPERLRLQHVSEVLFDAQHSPDGRLIAAAGYGTVSVWDAGTGAVVAQLSGHTGPVRRLSFSPDGVRMATVGQDGTLLLWDMSGL